MSGFGLSSPRDIATVDLNADGFLDLIVASYANDTVSVLQGGACCPIFALDPSGGTLKDTGAGPRTLAVSDFDEDGRPDILTGDQKIGAVSVFLNRTARSAHFR